jgi:uncharacterized membrane protein (UPF0136 family)
MPQITTIYGIYALVLILGGLIGYKQAGSKASVIAGTISGVIFILLALLSMHNERDASIMGTIVAFALVIVFLMRLINTRKLLPAAMLCLMSLAVAIASIMWMGLRG